MAQFGLSYPIWVPIDYIDTDGTPVYRAGAARVIGKEASADWTPAIATGNFAADNFIAHRRSAIVGGTIDTVLDDIDQQSMVDLFGGTLSGNTWTRGGADHGLDGGFGYITDNEDTDGVEYWESFFYPRTNATAGTESAATMGDSLTFAGVPMQLYAYCLNDAAHTYVKRERFTSYAAAQAWLQSITGLTTLHAVTVAVSGTPSTGESISPVGVTYVANAGSFTLSVTGATKLYDNGEDVTSSIDGGSYVLSGVSAAHSIVAIFS